MDKIFIYQVLPRLFGNNKSLNKKNGTIDENGTGKFSDFDDKALKEIKKMGFTHIWYTGIIEHATKTDYSNNGIKSDNVEVVKGNAGSPYAIKDYYDVSPDLADIVENRMQEFDELVARSHKVGFKVIMDFVPNHTARQYYSDAKPKKTKDFGANDDTSQAFSPDNNYYYIPGQYLELQFERSADNPYTEFPAKATGNDRFDNRPDKNDWYETVKLNYGVDYCNGHQNYFIPVPDTWLKMRDILIYWAQKGIDGFRCDMAEMVPVEFWNWVIPKVKAKNKQLIFIAEIYNPGQYKNYIHAGLFDYLYDKVDMYDTLRDVICGRRPTSDITFCWQRNGDLLPKMLNFLENHDEQRIASDFFAGNPFKAIPAMTIAAAINTNPVLIYSGQELGEPGMNDEGYSGRDGRTTIFDYWSIDSIRNWRNDGKFGNDLLTNDQIVLRKFYIQLINICCSEKAITDGAFYDLMYANYENQEFDSTKQFVFLRSYKKELLLILSNFDQKEVKAKVYIPQEAFNYVEINPQKLKKVTELFSKKANELKPDWQNGFEVEVNSNSSKILKFSAN